ncbi:PKD domain-containing protein [candidate division KSB1 bacterium]|nr:PKD domain-containing protein [candidate division KSB1 bacterium]
MNKGKAYFVFLCLVFMFLIFQSSYAADVLSGRVYEGNTGTEPPNAKALSGVTVTLYGSNNEDNLGTQIASTTTNSQGWYGLTAPEGYEFYSIVETDPSGYYSVGATSVSGTVISNNRIRYSIASAVLSDQTLTGNKFWDKPRQPANNPPIANADGPYSGTAGSAVTLDGTGSYDPDSGDSIASYAWDLDNDGQYDDATGATPSYTWNSATTITIWLKVTDTHGATDTDSTRVYIESQPRPCSAAFTAGNRQGCAPLTVSFTDQSSNVQSWHWAFPGGTPSSSTQQNPTIVYSAPGTYRVMLVIISTSGQVDSTIKVNYVVAENCPQSCEAAFDAEPREGCTPLTVNFTDLSTNAQSWQWEFPGGTPSSSTNQNPAVIYNNPGTFSVTLKIVCESGAVDSIINVDYITARECGDSLDFGDAPDPSYPTLLTNNGARHVINPWFYLGSGIDSEGNGIPTALADGDNNTGANDENGVTMSPFIAPGQSVPITIVASDTGFINAWIDFNIDGDWDDANEHVLAAQLVVPFGGNSFTVNVPAGASTGLTYARFRLSKARQLSYDGLAADGEVEDYAIEIREREDGSIIVIKEATPEDNTPFQICSQLNSSFFNILCTWLMDPFNNKFTILNPSNVISISEGQISGWVLKNIAISGDTDNGSTVNVAGRRVDVDHDPGENIVITFINQKGEEDLYDLGDAPDGTNHSGVAMNAYSGVPAQFPTVFDAATGTPPGPMHKSPKADAWLGADVSGERDADMIPDNDGPTNIDPPNGAANRDGKDDGVKVPLALPACQPTYFTYTVTVPANTAGMDRYVNVWFDWNRDGDWQDIFSCDSQNDAPEWAVQNHLISGTLSVGTYSFATPLFKPFHPAASGNTPIWMRISIADQPAGSSCGGCGPANGYQYGETEDYYFVPREGTGEELFDFGDAPDSPYPTLLNSNGARHVISPNLYLGTGIDPDGNGQSSAQADGDDKNITFPGIPYPSGDEDGVQIAPIVTTGTSVPVTVFASASGVVNAWLDLNLNGSWADVGEHIIAAQPVTAGANTFTLTIPAAAQSGQSYARFRLSSVRNISYDGPAPDGEVEDYPVVIQKSGEGKLTIIKDATPKDDTPFWISVVYGVMGGAAPYRDPSNNTSVLPNAPTGVYHIGEFVPTGWNLTDIVLSGDTDNGSSVDIANGKIDVDLDANENITVVFKNSKTGEEDIYDFGDAPDAANAPIYPTLHTNSGAYHDVIDGFHLGALIDAEPDGLPTPDAMGDDNLNLDDDDGVNFTTPLIPGQPAVVEVTASSHGILNAWIDFNANQSWGDANEHIFADVALSSGNNSLNFNVPPSAVPGQTFARFRLSRVTGISFTGYGHGGEVEDYETFIEEGEGGPPLKWNQIPLINEDPDMAWTPYFNGWDAKTVFDGTFVADDWFCKSPRPVTFIHWWGSYVDWDSTDAPPIAPHAFHIGVWNDVPAGEDKEWSHPGAMIWHWMVPRDALEERVAGDDFHPAYMSKPDTCFEYHFDIPKDEWFYQQGDSTVYWLSIAAVYEEVPDEFVWGWKTREHFFQDDAVYVYEPVQPEIGDIALENEPIDHGWDLAFVLGTDEYAIDYDFGDAPAVRYPTFFGQNGALHIIDPKVFLGRRIDAEADGQPNHSASGDDIDGSNDDDGIVFISPTTPGGTVTLEITASMNGYLNGWMDFDDNGSWADADEQIFIDEPLPGGLSTFTISVPDYAVPHEIFSRFRFSTVPGLSFVGIAIDGEVEDYYVNLKATAVERHGMDKTLPETFILYQNYPNPFNPDTEILFALPEPSEVKIMIFNTSGQFIRTLTSRHYTPGTHRIIWNGRDKEGVSVASGLYFYVLQASDRVCKKKMLLIK